MAFTLHKDIRYCLANDRATFLNLATDRYFCLPPQLDVAFQAVMRGGGKADVSDASVAALLRTGIFIDGAISASPATPFLPAPTRDSWASPVEGWIHPDHMFALACFSTAKRDIRSKSLKDLLSEIESARAKTSDFRGRRDAKAITSTAGRFRQIRAIVTVHNQCLIWSLALLRYLILRGFHTHLVIGVRLEPFSAHAWVQADDLVLSCPVDEASPYTPILVA